MEDRIRALEEALATLAGRIDRLEQGERSPVVATQGEPAPETRFEGGVASQIQTDIPSLSGRIIPLFGRSCLVICGAFLLRALTESNVMPPVLGVALGMVYATFWLAAAWMTDRKFGDRIGAEFHAITGLVIGFPILLETTHRFEVIGAATVAERHSSSPPRSASS